MSIKNVEKNITIQLAEKLANRGFRKRTGVNYLITRSWGEAEATISCAVRKDKTSEAKLVSLMLGIRFAEVANLVPPDAYAEPVSATIVTPIYSLHENTRSMEWDAEKPDTVGALLNEVETYAIPFFEKYSNLDQLLRTLLEDERPYPFWMDAQERVEKLAAILVLRGRKDEAFGLLDQEIEREKENHFMGRRIRLQKLRERFSNFKPRQ